MPPDHLMRQEELRALDIRWDEASMEWYRAMRSRYPGEIVWKAIVEAEDRDKELDVQLKRAFDGRRQR